MSGRTEDAWIVWCARKFHWTPEQTRRGATLRDLAMIAESFAGEED